jgi:hypothetical protein
MDVDVVCDLVSVLQLEMLMPLPKLPRDFPKVDNMAD